MQLPVKGLFSLLGLGRLEAYGEGGLVAVLAYGQVAEHDLAQNTELFRPLAVDGKLLLRQFSGVLKHRYRARWLFVEVVDARVAFFEENGGELAPAWFSCLRVTGEDVATVWRERVFAGEGAAPVAIDVASGKRGLAPGQIFDEGDELSEERLRAGHGLTVR